MDAFELRIGNYISRRDLGNGEPRIERILELGEKATTTGPIKVICGYDELIPVPLTVEWLTKAGFKHAGTCDAFMDGYYNHEKVDWVLDNDFQPCFEYDGLRIDICSQSIECVDQLQNFYFALTGTELVFGGGQEKV